MLILCRLRVFLVFREAPWAARPPGVPVFDCFGVPEGCAFIQVCNDGGCATVGVVVGPGVAGDAAMGGAVDSAPQYAAGVLVDDGGVHRLNSLASSVVSPMVYMSSHIGLGRV